MSEAEVNRQADDAMSITSATTSTSSVSFTTNDDVQIVKPSAKKNFDKHQPVGMFTMLGRGIRGKNVQYIRQIPDTIGTKIYVRQLQASVFFTDGNGPSFIERQGYLENFSEVSYIKQLQVALIGFLIKKRAIYNFLYLYISFGFPHTYTF